MLPTLQPLGTDASPGTTTCPRVRAAAWATWVVACFGRAQLSSNETENVSRAGALTIARRETSEMPWPPALFLPAIAPCPVLCRARPAPSPLLQTRSLRHREGPGVGARLPPPAPSPGPAPQPRGTPRRPSGGVIFACLRAVPGGSSNTFQPRKGRSVSPPSSPHRASTTKNSLPICS